MIGIRPGEWVLKSERSVSPAASVYAAEHAADGRRAAVKVFAASKFPAEFLARFAAEMLGYQRLNHPNVVRYFDAGVAAGQAWFAMELVDGMTTAELLKTTTRKPGLPIAEQVLGLAMQAARALKHGHHRNLLHRAIRPGTMVVLPDGTLKMTEFGLAKLIPETSDLGPDGFHPLAFQPPEFFTGKPYTRRSDLYALGCWLYALSTGRPMFAATTAAEFAQKHCYTLPDRPGLIAPDLPSDFDDLICTLIQKDPNRRPASAAQVIEELDRIRAKLERRSVRVQWPADPGDASGPMAAFSADDAVEREDRVRPLMSRPAVVLPLFLLVVGLGVWFALRRGPTAAELYANAEPLMQSADPADWDRAWDDYLTPLADRYPAEYSVQVADARIKIMTRKEIRRTVDQAARVRYAGEGERLYQTGLKLAQAGDVAGARRYWELLRAFESIPSEVRWVEAGRLALVETELLQTGPPASVNSVVNVTELLETAARWKNEGRAAEASTLLDRLAEIYRDDPPRAALIRSSR